MLVTGASGFIGAHLVRALAEAGFDVRAASRQPVVFDHPNVQGLALGDMSQSFAAEYAVRGVDFVIHAAGMAHAKNDLPDSAYTAINVDATRQLAKAARATKVKRFILMSSVRAQSGPSHEGVLNEETPPQPTDAYGRSKLEAERVTAEALEGAATGWTVIRPVLVYGPGVKGNMSALFNLARKPLPLPFGWTGSRRSILSIGNLTGALQHVIAEPGAANQTFLVADDQAVTMGEIVRGLRRGLGRAPLLVPVPQSAMAAALRLAGRAEMAERLAGGLVVDTAKLRSTGWRAAESTSDALAAAIRG